MNHNKIRRHRDRQEGAIKTTYLTDGFSHKCTHKKDTHTSELITGRWLSVKNQLYKKPKNSSLLLIKVYLSKILTFCVSKAVDSTCDFPLVAGGLGTESGGAKAGGTQSCFGPQLLSAGKLVALDKAGPCFSLHTSLSSPSQGKKHKPKPGLPRGMVETPPHGVAQTHPGTLAALLVSVHQFQVPLPIRFLSPLPVFPGGGIKPFQLPFQDQFEKHATHPLLRPGVANS